MYKCVGLYIHTYLTVVAVIVMNKFLLYINSTC
jgi:hypothetical protein